MNLASTIRAMAEKKDTPPFDVSKADYAGAAKELTQYAKTKGGMDKDDFLSFANRMASIAKKKTPSVMAKFVRDLQGLDTSPREKIVDVMRKNGIKVSMTNRGFVVEEHDVAEWEELEEAKVQGKEVFDKTFANRTQADNFAKKNGGRVKQVGRVFYVFKEAAEDEEPASPDEGSMAKTQLEFIEYAAEEVLEHIESGKRFPEWMQNKLTEIHSRMEDLHSALGEHGEDEPEEMGEAKSKEQQIADLEKMLSKISGNTSSVKMKKYALQKKIDKLKNEELDEAVDAKKVVAYLVKKGSNPKDAEKQVAKQFKYAVKMYPNATVAKVAEIVMSLDEEVELDEAKRDPSKSGGSGYDLYHKDFSSAMQHAYKYAKEKLGIEIDPKEIDDKVASGPRKPSSGKTNSYRLVGKDGKKAVQIQVANLDNKKYELNMYKEETNMDINEAFEEMFGEETEYQKFFKSALKKFGVSSPSELDGEKEKEFYDYVDKNWKGKDEKPEPEDKQESLSLEDTLMKVLFGEAKKVSEEEDEEESEDEEGTDDKADAKKKEKKKEKPEADDGTEPKDDTYKDIGKSGRQEKVSTKPNLDEADEKGEPMSDAEMKKRDDIMKGLEKKKKEFEDKYGDRAKEVMARTAIKMAKKLA